MAECTVPSWLATQNKTLLPIFLAVNAVGYLSYRFFGKWMNWQLVGKQPSEYFGDIGYLMFLSFVLFYFGNYGHTYSWITALFTFIGLYGFGMLGEISFLKTSLAGMSDWSTSAWIVYLTGFAVILG